VAQARRPSPKTFEPPPRQQPKLQTVLPKPPMLTPQYHLEKPPPPAAAPAPLPRAVTVARLAESAQQSEEHARQLYFRANNPANGFVAGPLPQMRAKAARGVVAVAAASNLGVRYSLLLKGADGEYAPARLDTEFHSGDSLRLRLEPNDSGYVYLFQRDSAGGWRLASTQRVFRGQPCVLPESGALQYDQPGRKELLVVLSPREQPSLGSLETTELDALADSVSADILKATVPGGEAAYAVDTRPQAGQQKVAFKITLEFH
jgi:hypothetical protein